MADDSDQVAAFKQGLSKLLMRGSLTDLTIVCGAYKHNVHKVILCAHSDYFAALPNFAEGKTNTLHFKAIGDDEDDEACDDPEAIKLMVYYFYHLDYTATIDSTTSPLNTPETKSARVMPTSKGKKANKASSRLTPFRTLASSSRDSDMVMHAKVFAAAVNYQIAALSKLAAKKFKDAVEVNWHDDTFAEAIRIVYSTTPGDVRALRDVVTTTLDRHDDTLLELDGVLKVVKESREVMFDLLCKGRGLGPFKGRLSISPPSHLLGYCVGCGGTLGVNKWGNYCTRCEME
ncbi:hypothetical protein KC343_g8872 [Hortaea werneckii]|nr:hypothetical protein KC352_g25498 [Hortaea werneckii]KAI7559376.1 hypothetical protein KC317_g10402 [Hortaea werneckii]KAI7611121.1 hypothetical protein KC346_g8447 [Hortaea werneckii]KAI7619030.1 hypothetical protein KC343_g8872 [Hortaea werneckii]KAI7650959.1 hypothetical protein KC319_g10963 [Hortaea werneckii]